MSDAEPRKGSPSGTTLYVLAHKECLALERALRLRKGRQDGIHNARKSSRRLRSLLTFLPSTVDKRKTALHKSLKQLAGSFSSTRDAHMAARTARLLATTHQAALTPTLLDAFEDRSKAILKQALKKDPDWRAHRAKVRRIVAAIARLPWQQVNAAEVKKAVKRNIRRVKKARKKALEERTAPAYHRWRRRARKLRYQLEWVHNARDAVGIKKKRAKRYDDRLKDLKLTIDQLGWRQDFAVFRKAVDQLPASADAIALRASLQRTSSSLSKASPPTPRSKVERAFVAHGSSTA
jgi:CHAD domain-containing protein